MLIPISVIELIASMHILNVNGNTNVKAFKYLDEANNLITGIDESDNKKIDRQIKRVKYFRTILYLSIDLVSLYIDNE